MLSRFFPARPPQATPPPTVPAGVRVYAVGDIHGCVGLLRKLHELIRADAADHRAARNVIVYLGDYIDRGEESRAVVELLLRAPVPGFDIIHLRGNHEDIMLTFLNDAAVGPAWLGFGGAATLLSYGVRPPDRPNAPEELDRAQRQLAEQLPDDHRRFMSGMKLTHVEGDYYFAHAGVRPGVPLDQQSALDLLWIRDDFLRSTMDFGKIVVHGHTPAREPDIRPNRINIDTGAYATGRLTCLVLEGDQISFL